MTSITEFKREFTRAMRGYAPEEVDAAIEMLVSYGAELESANAEFAEVNDELVAEVEQLAAAATEQETTLAALREQLAAAETRVAEAEAKAAASETELAALRAELATVREQSGEAKDILAEARRTADQLRHAAEDDAREIRARRTAEETRYNMLCRKTAALTATVRNVWREQIETLDALAGAIDADADPDETPSPAPIAEAEPVIVPELVIEPEPIAEPEPVIEPEPIAEPEPAPAEEVTVFTPPRASRIRRAAMAAAALEPDALDATPMPARTAARRPEPVAAPEPVETPLAQIFADAPTEQFNAVGDAPMADGVNVDAVYRPASPAEIKVKGEATQPASSTHSFAAVRRSLEEIGAKLKK